MNIVAFDPGGTTGCVIINATSSKEFTVEGVYQIKWEDRFDDIKYILNYWLEEPVDNSLRTDTRIVIEDFILYEAKAQELTGSRFPSSQIIGIIAAWCNEYGYDYNKIHFQMASQIHFSAIAQRIAGLTTKMVYNPRKEDEHLFIGKRHALDAYAHAMLFLNFQFSKKNITR